MNGLLEGIRLGDDFWWNCKYCGENPYPNCHKCIREDGKGVEDELFTAAEHLQAIQEDR